METVILKNGVNKYEGFITASKKCHFFSIFLPKYPSLENHILKCDWDFKLILNDFPNALSEIKECNSIESIVEVLKKVVLDSSMNQKSAPYRGFSYQYCESVTKELSEIGPCAKIKEDISKIFFEITDEDGRKHLATINLPSDYPNSYVSVEYHNLPLTNSSGENERNSFGRTLNLIQFHKKFLHFINTFQLFWRVLEVIDSNCWVVEPQNPQLSDLFRRIQISNHCSALLTFNPFNPTQRPIIEFRGMQNEADNYRELLARKLLDNVWEEDVDVHLNLLSILELEYFPMQENEISEGGLLKPGDCGICFEERLDGQPADQRCDNTLCETQYHQVCLLKYLCGNLRNVRTKNAILGQCPTCRDSIGCSTLNWDLV